MVPRVVVFVDYQNTYKSARAAFCEPDAPPPDGQVDPHALGNLIVTRRDIDSELVQVRIYRGQPDPRKDPRGYDIVERQCRAWRRLPKVSFLRRPLRYPSDWPERRPEEQGIDVALAVDFVLMAVRGEYDVGVIMSTDSDLRPALEAVFSLEGHPFPRCEVAAWWAPRSHSQRLAVPGRRIWCHWLDEDDYHAVADPHDYSRGAPGDS